MADDDIMERLHQCKASIVAAERTYPVGYVRVRLDPTRTPRKTKLEKWMNAVGLTIGIETAYDPAYPEFASHGHYVYDVSVKLRVEQGDNPT